MRQKATDAYIASFPWAVCYAGELVIPKNQVVSEDEAPF